MESITKKIYDYSLEDIMGDSFPWYAKTIIEEQNQKLADYRKDGHIYLVTEDTNNRIFLYDTTSKPEFEIEEIDFPEELRSVATEGKKFIFTNGSYKLYE